MPAPNSRTVSEPIRTRSNADLFFIVGQTRLWQWHDEMHQAAVPCIGDPDTAAGVNGNAGRHTKRLGRSAIIAPVADEITIAW